jgi:hypothetical protein
MTKTILNIYTNEQEKEKRQIKYFIFEDNYKELLLIDKKQELRSIFKNIKSLQKFANQNNLIITN